jgi:hypothetical protein
LNLSTGGAGQKGEKRQEKQERAQKGKEKVRLALHVLVYV